jgi:hypothetical protein
MEDRIIKSETEIVSPSEREEIDNIIKAIAKSIIESV